MSRDALLGVDIWTRCRTKGLGKGPSCQSLDGYEEWVRGSLAKSQATACQRCEYPCFRQLAIKMPVQLSGPWPMPISSKSSVSSLVEPFSVGRATKVPILRCPIPFATPDSA